MASHMAKVRWQIVVTVENMNHFGEIKFSSQGGIRVRMCIMLVLSLSFDQFQIVRLVGHECRGECALEVAFQEGCEENCREHTTGFASERVWAPRATAVALDKTFSCLCAKDPAVCHAIASCRSIGYYDDEVGILDILYNLWQVIEINVG